MIDGTGQAAIGLAVTILTEVSKTLMPSDTAKRLAPYLALVFSFLATVVYVLSMPTFPPLRTDLWALFMGWLTVYVTAVGAYHTAKLAGGSRR